MEKEQYRKFLAQFTAENFLNKVTVDNFNPGGTLLQPCCLQIPEADPAGNEIPRWKREMLAKKVASRTFCSQITRVFLQAAEKAKQESLDERARLEEVCPPPVLLSSFLGDTFLTSPPPGEEAVNRARLEAPAAGSEE